MPTAGQILRFLLRQNRPQIWPPELAQMLVSLLCLLRVAVLVQSMLFILLKISLLALLRTKAILKSG